MKSINRDFQCLKRICLALESTSERMRRPSLEFAWDKYVNQPIRDKEKERLKKFQSSQDREKKEKDKQ